MILQSMHHMLEITRLLIWSFSFGNALFFGARRFLSSFSFLFFYYVSRNKIFHNYELSNFIASLTSLFRSSSLAVKKSSAHRSGYIGGAHHLPQSAWLLRSDSTCRCFGKSISSLKVFRRRGGELDERRPKECLWRYKERCAFIPA